MGSNKNREQLRRLREEITKKCDSTKEVCNKSHNSDVNLTEILKEQGFEIVTNKKTKKEKII